MAPRKFSLAEIVSDAPAVVSFDLENQLTKKRRNRGGTQEYNHIKRAELQAFELILKQLQDLNKKIDRMDLELKTK